MTSPVLRSNERRIPQGQRPNPIAAWGNARARRYVRLQAALKSVIDCQNDQTQGSHMINQENQFPFHGDSVEGDSGMDQMNTSGQRTARARGSPGDGILAIAHELAGTVVGGTGLLLLTCALAGAIPLVLTLREFPNEGWPLLAAAWLGHLILAGLCIWGIAFVLIHIWCLYSLIFTEESRRRALAVAFWSQLTVSTIFTLNENAGTAYLVWGILTVILLPYLWRAFGGGKARAIEHVRDPRRRPDLVADVVQPSQRKRSPTGRSRLTYKRTYDKAKVLASLRSKVGNYFRDVGTR
jgi:hypothetical protein